MSREGFLLRFNRLASSEQRNPYHGGRGLTAGGQGQILAELRKERWKIGRRADKQESRPHERKARWGAEYRRET
jgi:hypothetical protein